jgi:hypothetical protein
MEICRWCGSAVSSDTSVCTNCGARLRRESTRCPRCKGEIRVGLAVCPHCGEELARRRIPWRLIGPVLGVVLAAILTYVLLSIVPIPISLPLIAAPPSPTPTEVILPPTATPTDTPRPPTAVPTPTSTFTPVITVTATITTTATTTPLGSPLPTETPTVTPTEIPRFRYAAPRLLGPEDGAEFTGGGTVIELRWEAVETLGEDEWYQIRLSYVNKKNEQFDEVVRWAKDRDIPLRLDPSYYDDLSPNEREIGWEVTIVWDPEGDQIGQPISPPSETWTFFWR